MTSQDIIIRILLSMLIGGVIGAERESSNKSAGFRTMILISLGSCLYTIFSLIIGHNSSPDRIASNIVTGIGFIGAGVIFKYGNGVQGITTAAAIWLTAALGMGIGGGYYLASVTGCVLALVVLIAFTKLEHIIDKGNHVRYYKIVCDHREGLPEHFKELFKQYHLSSKRIKFGKTGSLFIGEWTVRGRQKNHQSLSDHILLDDAIKEFEY